MLIEGELFKHSTEILKIVCPYFTRNFQLWYLFAYSLFQLGEYEDCIEIIEDLEELGLMQSEDQEIIEATLELKTELKSIQNSKN